MFVKELNIYIDFLKNKLEESKENITDKQIKFLSSFADNLNEGISYYQNVFENIEMNYKATKAQILSDLKTSRFTLNLLRDRISNLVVVSI
jgi:hypothetical protein